jgi:hypothetical protein
LNLPDIGSRGEPQHDRTEIPRGEAKFGTNRFHAYASAYLIRDHQRVTLVLTYVRASDSLGEVRDRLPARLRALRTPFERLYLNRAFLAAAPRPSGQVLGKSHSKTLRHGSHST